MTRYIEILSNNQYTYSATAREAMVVIVNQLLYSEIKDNKIFSLIQKQQTIMTDELGEKRSM